MKLSDTQDYPVENMSLVYSSSTNDVYQAVFQTEKFGTFTRVDGQWLALSPEDTSLENLSIIDILPEDYKEVTELFDAAQKANRYLKYDEVREFEVGYTFDGSAEALLEAENLETPTKDSYEVHIQKPSKAPSKAPIAKKDELPKLLFADLPPALQQLITDLIRKIANKFDEEETEMIAWELKGFVRGDCTYTENEISSKMAKVLRNLM